MIAVGRPGIEAELAFKDASSCAGSDTCFAVGNPSRAMVGTNAGTFYGNEVNSSGSPGADCWAFLYEDSGGWHYVNGRCVISEGYAPGQGDRVFVTGCANLRDAPGLSSQVIGCLGNWTVVDVDSAPTFLDGHIWWHLTERTYQKVASRGWMAHDFLVAPKNCQC